MNEIHEVLCPNFIECDICQRIRDDQRYSAIQKFTGNLDFSEKQNKHFYLLQITHQPTRETYFRFTLKSLKRTGRELINGLSSISGVSNRSWWNMFVESGIKFYSVSQDAPEIFPIIKLNFLMYSSKDNLDNRMHQQLKCRLAKINRDLKIQFTYLGTLNQTNVMENIDVAINFEYDSIAVQKLDEALIDDLNRLKDSRVTIFGKAYKNYKQLELA